MAHNRSKRQLLLSVATALPLLLAGGAYAEKKESFDGDRKSSVPDAPSGRTGGFGMGPNSTRLTTPTDSGSTRSGTPSPSDSSYSGRDGGSPGYSSGGYNGSGSVPRGPSAEEIERQRRYEAAVAATEAGKEAYRRGDYEGAIRFYEQARAQWPGAYADQLIAGARAQIAIRNNLREAEASAALGKDVWARDYPASWTAYERAAEYYAKALKHAPGDRNLLAGLKIVRGNAAAARANHAFYMIGDAKSALSHYERAVKDQPDNKDFRENLERARAAVQKEKNFEASNSSIRRIGSELARSVSADAGDTRAPSSEKGNTPFGTGAVKPDIPFAPIAPGVTPRSENTAASAASASKSGAAAATAAPHAPPRASILARCQFDGSAPGCETQKSPLVPITPSGRPPTQVLVFGGLNRDEWTKLQATSGGPALIDHAESLLGRKADLEQSLNKIKSSPNANQRQQEWIEQDKELQKVNKEIDGLPQKARQIINVYVLDDKPARQNKEPPSPRTK